jgi:hypothetical protein
VGERWIKEEHENRGIEDEISARWEWVEIGR